MAATPSQRIAREIARRIRAGELKAGQRVPSTRQIARDWHVAIATATRALAILRQDGLVEAVSGVGTLVSGQPPSRASAEPHPHLRRDQIVARAVAIADADGLEALSMRRLAIDLGIATMSLYRHIASKEELTVFMADIAMAEVLVPQPPPPGWQKQLRALASLQWDTYRRHRWLPHVISMTRPQMIPHGVAQTEWGLQALVGLGLDHEIMMQTIVTLFAFVRGVAVNLQVEAEAQQESGLTADQWLQRQSESMTQFMNAGPYPLISQITREGDIDLELSTLFEYGLGRMLDGFAIQFRARRSA